MVRLNYNTFMNLYIVRHGESDGNANRFISFSHTGLTAKGHQDARNLGKRLAKKNITIDRVYCSTLYRSIQTLEDLIKTGLTVDQKNIELTELIIEINRKEFEGRNRTEYYQQKAAHESPDDYCCLNGESENDVKARAVKFRKVLKKDKSKNVLIITHGHFLKHLMDLLGLYNLGHLTGASLSLVKITPKKSNVVFWNDTEHISQ